MSTVFFLREKSNLNLIIDVLGLQTDGAKHTSDTKGKVSVIKRIIYVTLYLGYYLVHT